MKPTLPLKAFCRWFGAAVIIPTRTVLAGSARAEAYRAAKLMAQLGGQPVPKKDASPLSDGLDSQTPLRITEFKRDVLGRLIHTLARNNDKVQETVYQYDLDGNLVRAANRHSITCFDYNGNGQIIGQHQWKVPTKEENARNGLPETDWRDAQYDMLYLPVTETVRYHYDFNGNRTATVLPDGRQINYLYYGSGHLHQISLDDEVISNIERDRLHREIYRTQGKLASRYELDPLGRDLCKISFPPTTETQKQVFGCFLPQSLLILPKYPLNPPRTPDNQASGPPFRRKQAHLAC